MASDIGSKTLVIDADAHVIETDHTWNYLDPSERKYRPVHIETPEDNGRKEQYWLIDGKVRGARFPIFSKAALEKRTRQTGRKLADVDESREMGNVDLRLDHMDQIGVDIEVLHNTIFIESVTERIAGEVALCKAWNRWLADIWSQGKGRLRWSCMPPTLSMSDALDEIRFGKENGACAVMMRPVEGNRLLADPYFYPIYDEASKLDMAITVHIANGNAWLNDIYGGHPVAMAASLHRFRVPTVGAFNDVLLSEIPQIFPKLRWGWIETGSQWVPWVLGEARHRWVRLGREWHDNIMSEYRMFVTCENSDDVPYIVQRAGEDCLLIGTDYGHTDTSSDLDAIKIFQARTDLTSEVKRKILSDNPRTLYGL